MEAQLSDKTFQQRLTYINESILAYLDIKKESPFVLLVLHEHLGLANYLRIIAQTLCNNELSICIPNLFPDLEQDSQEQIEDADFLKTIDQTYIANTLLEMVEYMQKKQKRVILLGLSLGAAIGLKLMEYLTNVELGIFFYGFPQLDQVQPHKIKGKAIVYVGLRDKIKYLSDKTTIEKAAQLYAENSKVQIVELEGARHGFMNPSSQNYSHQYCNDCCLDFQAELKELKKKPMSQLKFEPSRNNQNAQESKAEAQKKEKQKDEGCVLI